MEMSLSTATLPTPTVAGYLTLREAAEAAGLSERYIAALLQQGRIVGHREAQEWVVTRFSLEAYLKNRKPRGRPRKRI